MAEAQWAGDRGRRICSLCGERSAQDQIYFSRALSETEQDKYRTREAELDKLLCENCSTQAFKHIKRMFTLEHLGLTRPSKHKRHPHSGRTRADVRCSDPGTPYHPRRPAE